MNTRKPLVAKVTAKAYCVDVSVNDMTRILELDNRVDYGVQLHKQLERLGCYQIEYDGHFGPTIHYTLSEEDNTDEVQANIANCISAFIAQKMPRKQF